MYRVIWLAGAVALACSGRAAGPPPAAPAAPAPTPAATAEDTARLERDLPGLVARSLAMYRDIAGVFAASGADCKAATARLHELAPRYRAVTVANARVVRDGRGSELRAQLEPRNGEFDAAAGAVVQSPTMTGCVQDPAFRQAFDDLFDPGPGDEAASGLRSP